MFFQQLENIVLQLQKFAVRIAQLVQHGAQGFVDSPRLLLHGGGHRLDLRLNLPRDTHCCNVRALANALGLEPKLEHEMATDT